MITAGSGEEALSKLLDCEMSLIILDVRMPDMDGIETAELIRGKKGTQKIPIIFTSGYDKDKKIQFKGYETAPVELVPKPIDIDILMQKIKDVLK